METDRPNPAESKVVLRAEVRRLLAAMDPSEREQGSSEIRRQLAINVSRNPPIRILGFSPMATEPDLRPILRSWSDQGHAVYLPRWNPDTATYEAARLPPDDLLISGPFNVPEPAAELASLPMERLDLILVPGLAFDRFGRRLGRGKGFFDRLLKRAAAARRWGIAFDLQVVAEVPAEPHDVNLDLLVTPTLWHPVIPAPA